MEPGLPGRPGRTTSGKNPVGSSFGPEPVSLFCPECSRNSPVRGCKACLELRQGTPQREPGDDEEAVEEEQAQDKAERQQKEERQRNRDRDRPKSGAITSFDWNELDSAWGALYRQIDYFFRPYGLKESPQAERFRKALSDWKKDFTSNGKSMEATHGRRTQTVGP
jgi:hypothetical protein